MAAPTVHLTTVGGPPKGEGGGALHVTAMGPNLFLTIPLPPSGKVSIGRDESADVRILDEGASRLHAELHVGEGAELFIEDLGTPNGTFLREEKIAPRRRVAFQPGEAITIGYTILMVQRRRRPAAETRRLRTHAVFEERLHEACEHASATAANLALVRFQIDDEDPPGRAAELIVSALNATDLLAQYAPGDYEVLLPDTGADRPRALAERLDRRLRAEGLQAKSAVALFPADGRTADALIGRANEILRGGEAATGEPILKSETMRKTYRLAERAAAGQSANGLISILILGETGVGKDVLAKWVHRRSPRAKGPFVAINCGALPETLLESELFGHKKGTFTNAVENKTGLLEAAEGGTVFLDEIGDMPVPLQVKMLHALENREITRLGEVKPRPIDVRFIAATHRDLEARVASGAFRQDLYFRLNKISLTLPPLRERPDEIEPLAQRFLMEAVRAGGGKARPPKLSAEALELLGGYSWPGNARELRNMMERALVWCDGPEITVEDLEVEKMRATTFVARPPAAPADQMNDDLGAGDAPPGLSADERDERALVIRTLAECAGSQSAAAKKLGWARGTLIDRLKRYGIRRPRAKTRS